MLEQVSPRGQIPFASSYGGQVAQDDKALARGVMSREASA